MLRSGGDAKRPAVGSGSGTLVVAATPWGEVVAIVDADGAAQPLPDDPTTPVAVELPAGEYTVRVWGPDGGEPVERTAAIAPGETVRTAPAFSGPDADELLTRYGL
jgi:hypothetical protein